ncbi:hypothetical protein J5N97_004449 [Dioscorea zingiberensis]|uniref:UDP-glycosyltransferases domain-containing protein n=1 Tax=Dioscorea zingiberensis TaxID=325984 RepID=A0A9D5D8F7_9LILI|nr:hypothetical protein J5N97_004449 [Dioscorea zingiberensis]
MTFTLDAAKELAIPITFLCTTSACGYLCYFHYQHLIDQGLVPLKNEGCLTNGYLDTPIPWFPGMKDMHLRDFPTFVRTTDPDDILFNFTKNEARRATQGSAIIINSFDELERPVLDAMRFMLSTPVYSIGPLSLLSRHIPDGPVSSLGSSLWTEDTTCLGWLDLKDRASVLYVNFGSVTVMSKEELVEFAWGLANSKLDFLWVVRSDLVREEPGVVMQEFLEETKERGMVTSWCPQEAVLAHPVVGGFLTHSGWNSTLESIAGGVPMLSWPFLSEQPTNCKFVCGEWGIGMEIGSSVKRGEVEMLVKELMVGEKGMEMRKKTMVWKESARRACDVGGSSMLNLERVINDVLLPPSTQLGKLC